MIKAEIHTDKERAELNYNVSLKGYIIQIYVY
jgi:hypothetical protein